MATKNTNRRFKEEVYTLILNLQFVHDEIMKNGEISKELKERTQEAAFKVSEWETTDPDTKAFVKTLITITVNQLTLSERTKAKKKELWGEYIRDQELRNKIHKEPAGIP